MANKDDGSAEGIDRLALGVGFVLGMFVGGVAALFKTPKTGSLTRRQLSETGQTLRTKLVTALPGDPIAESIAEGKAAARRRRSELGLDE